MKTTVAPLAIMVLFAAGCTSNALGDWRTNEASTSTIAENSVGLDKMAGIEQELAVLRSENSKLKSARSSATKMPTSMQGNVDLPPAKPGECFARILVPAKYETTSEKIVVAEGSVRVEIIPARYETLDERVLVSDASELLEVIPATYKNVTETVVVEPAQEELRTIPAKYRTVSERILVREGYTTWKKGEGPIGGTLSGGTIKNTRELSTGEIMCLVEVPAEYRNVSKQVLVEPARTSKTTAPAVTKTLMRRLVATPATTRAVNIPAKYDTVRVRKQLSPATERRISIPATFKTVTKQKKVTEERLLWREVLCDTNTTPGMISRVQQALNTQGFSLSVDGTLGPSTLRAIDAYQRRNNLGTGGLTMATVKKLGVM